MTMKAVQQIMLGSVVKNERTAAEVLRSVKEAGYDGIELNGFMIRPTPLLVRALTRAAGMPSGAGGKLNWKALIKEAGLRVVSVHEDLGTIKRDPDAVLREASDLGTDQVVITGMYRFDYTDREAVDGLARDLNEYGRILKDGGVELLYHNHNCELLRLKDGSGTRAYERLIEGTEPDRVGFEFDSYWFTEGGADALSWMERLGTRMKLWHINDRGTRQTGASMTPILKSDSMELGYGNLPLERLSEAALKNGVRAVVLESHRNWAEGSPVKSLQLSAAFMNRMFS